MTARAPFTVDVDVAFAATDGDWAIVRRRWYPNVDGIAGEAQHDGGGWEGGGRLQGVLRGGGKERRVHHCRLNGTNRCYRCF
jgi:hypothetical protein